MHLVRAIPETPLIYYSFNPLAFPLYLSYDFYNLMREMKGGFL